jgi:hypothetical protein
MPSANNWGLSSFPCPFVTWTKLARLLPPLPRRDAATESARASEVSAGGDDKGEYVSDRRTGRRTTEEIALCDKLIDTFQAGPLPILDGE